VQQRKRSRAKLHGAKSVTARIRNGQDLSAVDIAAWVKAYRLMAQRLKHPAHEGKLAAFKLQLQSLRGFDRTDFILKMKREQPAFRSALNEIIEGMIKEKYANPSAANDYSMDARSVSCAALLPE
jgi:hypothetical protein